MRRDLARKHLDRRLSQFQPASAWTRPPRGWIRAIRDALGMTAEQMAARLGVSQPRVMAMEKAEEQDRLTLQSLRRAAEALDCTLVYALVPNVGLEAMVRKRAGELAGELLLRIDQTMSLENQGACQDDLEEEREHLVAEMLRGNPHRVWDTQ